MQQLLVLALLVAGAAASGAEAGAHAWLSAHPDPNADALAELKTANPDAYGIVKALLMKQSLGLLAGNRHPMSSSFSAPPQAQQEDAPVGAAAFAKFAAPGELKKEQSPYPQVPMAYAEAPMPHHGNNFNWKPSGDMDDEAMVKQVLGAVADLKGKKPSAGLLSSKRSEVSSDDSNPFAKDESFFAPPAAPAAQPVRPAPVAAVEQNSYLSSIEPTDLFKPRHRKQTAKPLEENSYLKGLDLVEDAPVKVVNKAPPTPTPEEEQVAAEVAVAQGAPVEKATPFADTENASPLNGFSFDDAAPKPKPKAALAVKQVAQTRHSANALDNFLGLKEPAPPPQAVAKPAPVNQYMNDLS